jgi:hypothetical protein
VILLELSRVSHFTVFPFDFRAFSKKNFSSIYRVSAENDKKIPVHLRRLMMSSIYHIVCAAHGIVVLQKCRGKMVT